MKRLYLAAAMLSLSLIGHSQERFVVINETPFQLELAGLQTCVNTYDENSPYSIYPLFYTFQSLKSVPNSTDVFENADNIYSFPLGSVAYGTPDFQWFGLEDNNSESIGPFDETDVETLVTYYLSQGGGGQMFYSVKASLWDDTTNPPTLLGNSHGISPYGSGSSTYATDGINYELFYYELNVGTSDKMYVIQAID